MASGLGIFIISLGTLGSSVHGVPSRRSHESTGVFSADTTSSSLPPLWLRGSESFPVGECTLCCGLSCHTLPQSGRSPIGDVVLMGAAADKPSV